MKKKLINVCSTSIPKALDLLPRHELKGLSFIPLALPGIFVFIVIEILLTSLVWMDGFGDFSGPDSYMRVARILECRGGWTCPEGLFARSNVPFGEVLHWPFLLDRIILAISFPFFPFLEFKDAVILASHLVGPLLGVGSLTLLTAGACLLLPKRAVYWVPIIAATHYWTLFAFAPVRPDHHGLQLFAFLLILLGVLKILTRNPPGKGDILMGVGVGIAVWISTEGLISLTPLGLTLLLFWIIHGGDALPRAIARALLLAIAILSVGLVLDGPEPYRWAPDFDRFSIVHLATFLLAGLFWEGARSRVPQSKTARAFLALLGMLALGAILMGIFPGIHRGPMADMDRRLIPIWLNQVREFLPALRFWGSPWGPIALVSGLVALIFTIFLIFGFGRFCLGTAGPRELPSRLRAGWTALGMALFWFLLLASFGQVRWAHYLHILAPIGMAALLVVLFRAWENLVVAPLFKAAGKVATVILFLFWQLVPLMVLSGSETPENAATQACTLDRIVEEIRLLEAVEEEPLRVLAPVFRGPELLFRTQVGIVAGPYHRNAKGILDSHRIMATTHPAEALDLLEKRGIDLIILCTQEDWMPLVPKDSARTVYAELVSGHPPEGLEEVRLDSGSQNFRIFRVTGER